MEAERGVGNLDHIARLVAGVRCHLERPALFEERRAALLEERGTLEVAPHPGHEPGDVVEVTDATLGLHAEAYRVTSVELDYARQPRGKYLMRLGLGRV